MEAATELVSLTRGRYCSGLAGGRPRPMKEESMRSRAALLWGAGQIWERM